MTKDNTNPLLLRIGVVLLFLSIIIYFINRKIMTKFNLDLIG